MDLCFTEKEGEVSHFFTLLSLNYLSSSPTGACVVIHYLSSSTIGACSINLVQHIDYLPGTLLVGYSQEQNR